MITSTLILGALLPLVFLNGLNKFFCPGCSLHQLLIFRDHKPPERQGFEMSSRDGKRPAFGKSFWNSEKTTKTSAIGSEKTQRTYHTERTDLTGRSPRTPLVET